MEREIAYAIRHWDLVCSLEAGERNSLETVLSYLAFDTTCRWVGTMAGRSTFSFG